MRSKSMIWGLVLILFTSIVTPLFGIYTAQASENEKTAITLIDEPNLRIVAESEKLNHFIHWDIQYEVKTNENHEGKKLKFKFFENQVEMSFPDTKGWSMDQENDWFIRESWEGQGKGKISFVTEDDKADIHLEVQLDRKLTKLNQSEIVEGNILSQTLQGPYTLFEASKNTPDVTANSSVVEVADVSESSKNEAVQEEAFLPQPNDIQQVIRNEGLPLTLANVSFDYDYVDPFNYETNNHGTVPTPNINRFLKENDIWTNEVGTTSNFNFGVPYNEEPPTSNILGGNLDFFNGYHTYQNPDKPNSIDSQVLTKKTVKPTSNPNEFEIEIDVIGGASEIAQPTDIVFVIDRSGSMRDDVNSEQQPNNDGSDPDSRWQILKKAMEGFTNNLLAGDNDIRVGLVGFGSEWNGSTNTAVWATQSRFNNGSSFTTDPSSLLNNPILTDKLEISGTPTYHGVELGTQVLRTEGRPNAVKYLIVLTDGTPTFSPAGKSFPVGEPYRLSDATRTNYPNIIKHSMRPNQFWGNGVVSDVQYPPSFHASQTSNYLRNYVYNQPGVSSFIKYAVGLGVPSVEQVTASEVLALIAEQSQQPINQRDRVLDARNSKELEDAMEKIKRQVFGSTDIFTYGKLKDPMSDYVELISNVDEIEFEALSLRKGNPNQLIVTPETSPSFPNYAKVIQENTKIINGIPNQEIQLSEMNLGTNGNDRQGIRFKYKVRLKEAYRDGKFYPTNGPTSTKAYNYDEAIGFAVPSVRSDVKDLEIEKQWLDDQKHPELRQDILLQLQRKESNNQWQDIVGKIITIKKEGPDYTGKFEKLPTVKEIILEDGAAKSVPHEYRVVETRVPGYDVPEIIPNPDDENKIIVKNKLLMTQLAFTKVDEEGEGLSDAEFTLFRKNSNGEFEKIDIIHNTTGVEFLFEDLPIGDYVLRETKTPAGFVTREDLNFQIVEDVQGDTVGLKIVGLPDDFEAEGIQIKNEKEKVADFQLSILKMDQQNNQALSEVTFSLTKENDDTILATAKSDSQGIGIFKDNLDQPFVPEIDQIYEIKETNAKEGYVLSDAIFKLVIQPDGRVVVTESGEKYEEIISTPVLDEEGNLLHTMLQLKIWNTPKGILPSTGGQGRQTQMLVSIVLIGIVASIGGFYVYRNRKEAQ